MNAERHSDGARAAEAAARGSYGRLVALLSRRTRDIAAAEDALGGALIKALERWPEAGVPDRPEAWLLTVAQRSLIDQSRRSESMQRIASDLAMIEEERRSSGAQFQRDDRLRLMLACANPAIDERSRAPLILQTLLGIDARRMASAFVTTPDAMTQRLVRAKAKIRDAGVSFDAPDGEAAQRIGAVLDAIYAAFTLGWDGAFTPDEKLRGLTDEAIWLGRIVCDLAPQEPEAQGLLALMLFAQARAHARRDAITGAFVPISKQDTRTWAQDMVADAEDRLRSASIHNQPGRFQYEAAIQAVHCDRMRTGVTRWSEIEILYEGLVRLSPTLGARVALAAARAEAGRATTALEILEALGPRCTAYQPYWAVRAHVLALLGRRDEAGDAFTRAAGLTDDPAVRAFLLSRKAAIG